MNEKKLKHLEFIQNVITRMNSNSFLIKGWSVTLVSAIMVLAQEKTDPVFSLVVFMPVIVFWNLDAFFLCQERQYRGLYRQVAARSEAEIDFSMDATAYKNAKTSWSACLRSGTLLIFHGALFFIVLLFVLKLAPDLLSPPVPTKECIPK